METTLMLQKLFRLVNTYDMLSKVEPSQLSEVESDLLDSLENYILPLLCKAMKITDTTFNEYVQTSTDRSKLAGLPEINLSIQGAGNATNLDEALAFGTGLAIGGALDYLADEPVAEPGTVRHSEVGCLTDEELEELESQLDDEIDLNEELTEEFTDIEEIGFAAEVLNTSDMDTFSF